MIYSLAPFMRNASLLETGNALLTSRSVEGISMASQELIQLAQQSQVKLPRKDLLGQPFGRLVVVQYLGTEKIRGKGKGRWLCDCKCGNTKIVTTEALTTGNTQSCGCFKREAPQVRLRKDLTDQRFGRLVVQRMLYRTRQKTQVECLCDCGTLHMTTSSQLVGQKTSSCGCLQRDEIQARKRKDITGERFGRLVVQCVSFRHRGKTVAECLCDCGETWEGPSSYLLSGDTNSCGCLKKELDDSKRRSEQHKREVARLVRHRRIARDANLPCTFTSADLAFMLQYWDFACAVCGREEGFWHVLAMDHFIPIASPDCPGTTSLNILPLCHTRRGAGKYVQDVSCNTEKHDTAPLLWLTAKLGPRRAKAKLKEIERYFSRVQERSALCIAS